MQTVGVRELRERLARVLHDVQAGETIVVTRAGAPIARLEPMRPGVPPEVQRLLETGDVTWNGQPLEPLEPIPIGPGPDVADLLIAQRGGDAVPGQ
jgi:prevent-host-death family protein